MEDDNRPGENPDDEESGAGWYFDLPQGAWERQEAKNRELRQTVRRNINEEQPKDVFGGARKDEPDQDDEPGPSWGAEQPGEPAEQPRVWAVPTGAEDEAARPALHLLADDSLGAETDDEPDYSTEPDLDSPTPFTLRSRRVQDDDEPRLEPPAGLFGFEPAEAEDRPPANADDAAREAAPPFPRGFARHEAPEEPTPFVRGDREQAVEHERPRSRWGELFSDKASEGATMLDGMRSWAHNDTESAAQGVDKQGSDVDASARIQSRDELSATTPIPIRVQRHDADEPPLVNSENPQTRWDHMFARKAADDSGMLDGMRAWATKPADEEDLGPPQLSKGRKDEPDGQLFEPFAWEDDRATIASSQASSARVEEPEAEKKGLFGKLFGKKKRAEQDPEPAHARDAWLPAEDSVAEDEVGAVDDPHGEWLGRSDGDENRLSPANQDLPWPPVGQLAAAAHASGWHAEDEDEEQLSVRLPQDDLPDVTDIARDVDHPASWLDPEPSDDDKSRFSELSSWFTPRDDAAAAPGQDLPARLEPVAEVPGAVVDTDLEMWEPASWETPTDGQHVGPVDTEPDEEDEFAWEPVASSAAHDAPAIEPLAPETDDDPWAPLQAVEDLPEEEPVAHFAVAPMSDEPVLVAASMDEPGEAEAEEPEAAPADDPWAAYLRRQSVDALAEAPEAAPAVSPAAPAGEGESLWDSAFARVHDEALAEEESAVEPAADDPWAAISRATAYDELSPPVPDFSASTEVESALHRYEAERKAEEAYQASTAGPFPTAVDAAVDLPPLDDSLLEDDTVLRAFQAHASYSDEDEFGSSAPSATDNDTLIFDELLGEDAEEIVAEASQPAADNRYFGRMQGWAPQRTRGERQPFPWEKDLQEPARKPDAREEADAVLQGWGRTEDAPPPWDSTPAAAPAAHTDAPSVRRKSRARVLVREIVETGLLALLVFLSVRASFQNFKVDGYSMWPTLDDGEYLIVNKLAYSEVDMDRLGKFVPFVSPGDDPTREVFGGPSRGDIVVLKDPRETNTDLIKRIVGLPGETLQIVDGKVYINDHLLVEPYIKEEWHDEKQKLAIPEGFYFVMGDNRNNSMDSRSSQIALISKDLLIGKAMVTYWPRDKFGLAPNDGGNISEEDGPPVVTTERVPE